MAKDIRIPDRFELWSLDRLRPYEKNARTHSSDQVSKIAASILEFGFANPVLVDGQDGIIAGHGRLLAARQLGMEQVPVVVLDHLTDVQRRAYILADNRLALDAGWDEDLLASELDEMRDLDFSIQTIGFTEKEISELIGNLNVSPLSGMPALPSGEKSPFQKMTFTVSDEQAEQIKEAIEKAKSIGPFLETGNENSNGNAISRICETFVREYGKR